MEEGLRGLEGFEDGNFSAALHQELLFDYKPEIAEKLAGEFDLKNEKENSADWWLSQKNFPAISWWKLVGLQTTFDL